MEVQKKKRKITKKLGRKPKLDLEAALTARALGASKAKAARIAGSEAKHVSSQTKAYNNMLIRAERKEVFSKLLGRGVELYDKSEEAALEMLDDKKLSAKEKVTAFSPLSAVKALEGLHKIDRLENDQSTENIAHEYINKSPQQIKQIIIAMAAEEGMLN